MHDRWPGRQAAPPSCSSTLRGQIGVGKGRVYARVAGEGKSPLGRPRAEWCEPSPTLGPSTGGTPGRGGGGFIEWVCVNVRMQLMAWSAAAGQPGDVAACARALARACALGGILSARCHVLLRTGGLLLRAARAHKRACAAEAGAAERSDRGTRRRREEVLLGRQPLERWVATEASRSPHSKGCPSRRRQRAGRRRSPRRGSERWGAMSRLPVVTSAAVSCRALAPIATWRRQPRRVHPGQLRPLAPPLLRTLGRGSRLAPRRCAGLRRHPAQRHVCVAVATPPASDVQKRGGASYSFRVADRRIDAHVHVLTSTTFKVVTAGACLRAWQPTLPRVCDS
eukprot:scaffold2610_cov301-Prasinococcus_capsulatus_cf.AAC.2